MKQYSVIIALLIVVITSSIPTVANAQSGADDYGVRIRSRDGQWLAPAATLVLGSTDDEHIGRGSINSWDWSAKVGSPVFASRAGTVEAAGCNLYETRKWPIMQGYGCAVSIKHGGGVVSQYGHCAEGSIRVKVGEQVNEWTQLCNIGRTGVTSFDHLHFTILVNGAPIRIDGVFDIAQMKRCHLCSGKNDPMQPILKDAVADLQAEATQPVEPARNAETVTEATRSTNALAAVLIKLSQLPLEIFGTILLGSVLLFLLLPRWRQTIVLGAVIAAAALFTSEVPVANIKASSNSVAHAMPDNAEITKSSVDQEKAAFEAAYAFLGERGVEGNSCTNDGAYTKGGVTQGAYNAWRKRHGLPTADVCQNLTNEEKKAISYEDYWVKSGADEIARAGNIALSRSHFDFAFNAGSEPGGPPSKILAQCGGILGSAECYNKARIEWYKTRRQFNLYGQGWLNRVNKLMASLEQAQY